VEAVSVIIPLYNKEKHIERAINSVLNQTVQNFEIIVVDDGSTDAGADIVRQFDDERIRLIQQNNQGVSAARNKGIKNAQNPLIAFLDADDSWEAEFLETIHKLRKGYPEAGIYATAYQTSHERFGLKKIEYFNIPDAPWAGIIPDFFKSMHGQPPVWTSATVVPRKVFDDVGYFQVGEVIGEDVDMWCRVALKYPVAFDTKVCATYYLDSDNRTYVKGSIHKKAKGYLNTLNHALKDPDLPVETKENIGQLREMVELGYASSLILGDERKTGRKLLKELDLVYLEKKRDFWIIMSYLPTKLILLLMDVKQKIKK
jgi:glycosyltransferase involved in cell wall biosynthesis